MENKFEAINDYVIVKSVEKNQTESGLYKPSSATKKKDKSYGEGVVLSVGQECKYLKEGDKIMFLDSAYVLEEKETQKEIEFIVSMRESMILGKIK